MKLVDFIRSGKHTAVPRSIPPAPREKLPMRRFKNDHTMAFVDGHWRRVRPEPRNPPHHRLEAKEGYVFINHRWHKATPCFEAITAQQMATA